MRITVNQYRNRWLALTILNHLSEGFHYEQGTRTGYGFK